MKKGLFVLISLFLICSIFCSCKKQNQDIDNLQKIVEQINAKSETELSNGTILTKCEYKECDSLLTYYIKVKDKRFEEEPVDSIKNTLFKDLSSPEMSKLVGLLARNNIGIKYVYDTEDKDITIVFSHEELKSK
jgi:hypothetical protein